MIVASPEASLRISKNLARMLGAETTFFSEKTFPDGEVLIRVQEPEKIRGEDKIVLYFPLYPKPNEGLVKLLQALDMINDYSPNAGTTLILPYLVYGRQDKRFLKGEAHTLKTFTKILEDFGTERLITIDCHNPDFFKESIQFKFENTTALTEIARYAARDVFKGVDFVLVSPDQGGEKRVRTTAKALGLEYIYLEKTRDTYSGEVSIQPPDKISIEGRKILVLDDVISTGGTMAKASPLLTELGASLLVAGATHLLLLEEADKKLLQVGYRSIIGTNTVESPYSKVSVEALIVEALKKL